MILNLGVVVKGAPHNFSIPVVGVTMMCNKAEK